MPLPQIPSVRTKRSIWEICILWPVERMTEHLYSGAYIHDDDLKDMYALRQRLRAFDKALEAREIAAGIDDDRHNSQ